jgi:hypothetical protein
MGVPRGGGFERTAARTLNSQRRWTAEDYVHTHPADDTLCLRCPPTEGLLLGCAVATLGAVHQRGSACSLSAAVYLRRSQLELQLRKALQVRLGKLLLCNTAM